jgi:tetratricopeptide (TPR) repeat protein
MGSLETDLGRYANANKDLISALKFSKDAEDPLEESTVLVATGKLATEMGDFDLARQDFEDALKYYGPHGDQEDKARAQLGLGKLENVLGNSKKARQNYNDAFKVFANIPNDKADDLFLQGELERGLKKYAQALEDYTAAQKIYLSGGNQVGEAKIMLGFGDLAREQSKNEDAKRYYGEARGLFQKQESKIDEADVDLSEGILLGKIGQRKDALGLLRITKDLYSKMGKSDKAREASAEIDRFGGRALSGH